LAMDANVIQLEDAGVLLWLVDDFPYPLYEASFLFTNDSWFCIVFLAAKTLVTLSSKEKESPSTEAGPSAMRMGIYSRLLELGMRSR
jgi:hypothetical protein